VLRRNLGANGITDVKVVEAALWTEKGQRRFFSEGADGNRLVDDAVDSSRLEKLTPVGTTCKVETVKLTDYLSEGMVDFVKLDIEGAEADVLLSSAEDLHRVLNIAIEFHLTNSKPKALATTFAVLADAGFHVAVGSYGPWVDLIHRSAIPSENRVEFDQNLLICAWR